MTSKSLIPDVWPEIDELDTLVWKSYAIDTLKTLNNPHRIPMDN